MALRFTPYPYRERPTASDYAQKWSEGLSSIGDTIYEGSVNQRTLDRQRMLDNLIRQEYERKYGKPINPNEMVGIDTGQTAKTRSFGSVGVGQGTPLIEAFNKYRSENYPSGPQSAMFQPYLSENEREKIFERDNPKKNPITYQAKEYTDAQGRARIGRFNPATGQIEKMQNDEYAPQTARGETAGNLRKEFIDRPEVKEYQTISTQVKSMDSLLHNALSGNLKNQVALDQALISMYNKLTDPQSVVRESEYARTGENLPVVNRISGAIQKVQAGGAGLTNEDRKALVLGAKIIANERGKTYTQTRSGYVNLAGQMSLDPSLITATMPEFSPYSIKSQPQETKTIGGRNFIKINGEWYER